MLLKVGKTYISLSLPMLSTSLLTNTLNSTITFCILSSLELAVSRLVCVRCTIKKVSSIIEVDSTYNLQYHASHSWLSGAT